MDKKTEKRFSMIIENYREVANRLGVSLQELQLLVLSEQIKDLTEILIPDIGSGDIDLPPEPQPKKAKKEPTKRPQKEKKPPEEPKEEQENEPEMTVRELNHEQLQQLKRHYYHMKKLENGGHGATFAEFAVIDTLVSDEEIFEKYANVKFTKYDFFI